MRKIILSCVLIVLLLVTFVAVRFGIGSNIHSYRELKEKSNLTNQKLNELTALKAKEYTLAEKELKKTVSNHIEIKKKYDQISSTKTEEQKEKALSGGAYDLGYIWIVFGKYATENQCDLGIEVSQVEENEDDNYIMCDLKFTITSSYDGAIEFINRVTADNELGFIPENLKMHSEYKTVKTVNEDGSNVVTSKRLMLVTEFYKSNVAISKASLLKVENGEKTKE